MIRCVIAPGDEKISPLPVRLPPIQCRDGALGEGDATIHFFEQVVLDDHDQLEDWHHENRKRARIQRLMHAKD